MKNYNVSVDGLTLVVEGFASAEKLIELTGPRAKRIADLALHRHDLRFAKECLSAIKAIPSGPDVVAEALWQAALINFIKCFGGNDSRFQLSEVKVFRESPPAALKVFGIFKSLRNKHFVHDANAWLDAKPSAILNKRGSPKKIEEIICVVHTILTLTQDNHNNLRLLVESTLEFVEKEFENESNTMQAELEQKSFDELVIMNVPVSTAPHPEDIHKNRAERRRAGKSN